MLRLDNTAWLPSSSVFGCIMHVVKLLVCQSVEWRTSWQLFNNRCFIPQRLRTYLPAPSPVADRRVSLAWRHVTVLRWQNYKPADVEPAGREVVTAAGNTSASSRVCSANFGRLATSFEVVLSVILSRHPGIAATVILCRVVVETATRFFPYSSLP